MSSELTIRRTLGLLAVSLAVVAVWACRSSGEQTGSEEPAEGAGSEILPLASPISRAPGTAFLPALSPDKVSEQSAAIDDLKGKEPFRGEFGSFRFFSSGDKPIEYICDKRSSVKANVEAAKWPFDIGYFPPGTLEVTEPTLFRCADGRTMYAIRSFRVGPGAFSVSYSAGELAYHNDSVAADRLSETPVAGVTAVLASAITNEGFGDSFLLWPIGDGYIRVYSVDLPPEHLEKIAEGLIVPDQSQEADGEAGGGSTGVSQ